MRLRSCWLAFPVFILFGSVLFACAGAKKVFVPVEPSAEKGSVLYVYRPAKAANVMLTPKLGIAGVEKFELASGDYKQLYLAPGKHVIKLEAIKGNTPEFVLELDVVKAHVHYLQVDASMKFEVGQSYQPYQRKFALKQVTAEVAMDEIAGCKNIDETVKPKSSAMTETDSSEDGAGFSVDKTLNPFSH